MDSKSVKIWIDHVEKNIDSLEASINIADKYQHTVKNHLLELGINASYEEIEELTELIRQTIRYIRLANL